MLATRRRHPPAAAPPLCSPAAGRCCCRGALRTPSFLSFPHRAALQPASSRTWTLPSSRTTLRRWPTRWTRWAARGKRVCVCVNAWDMCVWDKVVWDVCMRVCVCVCERQVCVEPGVVWDVCASACAGRRLCGCAMWEPLLPLLWSGRCQGSTCCLPSPSWHCERWRTLTTSTKGSLACASSSHMRTLPPTHSLPDLAAPLRPPPSLPGCSLRSSLRTWMCSRSLWSRQCRTRRCFPPRRTMWRPSCSRWAAAGRLALPAPVAA